MIFDDPAEQEMRQRPVMVRSGRGPFRPARARRARAMHNFFFEKFSTSQVYSSRTDLNLQTKAHQRHLQRTFATCISTVPVGFTK